MATTVWLGRAQAIANKKTVTITAFDSATTYKLTLNAKTVSTVGLTDTTVTATNLATAWNASTDPEMEAVTALASTNVVTLTSDTAGVPMGNVTSSVTGGIGTIGSVTETVANDGPNNWETSNNWSEGSVPGAGDDVVFQNSAVNCKYQLDQNTITVNSLTIYMSFTGQLGLQDTNPAGYREHIGEVATPATGESKDLKINCATVLVGVGDGAGPRLVRLDALAVTLQKVTIINLGTPMDSETVAMRWKGITVNHEVTVNKGAVGIAYQDDESALVFVLRVGQVSALDSDALVFLGPAVTITTIDKSGGLLECDGNFTTLTQTGGTTRVRDGTGTLSPVVNCLGGRVAWNCALSTITPTFTVTGNAILDFSEDLRAKAITGQIEYHSPDAQIIDPHKVVASLVIDLHQIGSLSNLNLGKHIRLTRGAVA